jgi:hypothetical protein
MSSHPTRKKNVSDRGEYFRQRAARAAKPISPERLIEDILVFDARALDKTTMQNLLRSVPQLVHIRRAWKAYYLAKGCPGCQKKSASQNPTLAIAVRLQDRGFTWQAIHEILGTDTTDRAERKRFENAADWKAKHPNSRTHKSSSSYGAGGFCDRCYSRILNQMRKYRTLDAGRDFTAELAAFTEALALKFNVAQRLLNAADIANIPNVLNCKPRRLQPQPNAAHEDIEGRRP